MCIPTPPKRILAVFGTEMGSTKTEASKIVEEWQKDDNFKVTMMEGNDAADKFDTITTKNYDVLVVMTSSYGDGDAPSGFGKFLYKIYASAEESQKSRSSLRPLDGLEHSVLGFGSTAYYTFMNVPRLCDRLLGESGSRRFLMREEVDEMEDYDENKAKVKKWTHDVAKHCNEETGTSKDEPVCEWTSPKEDIYDKKLGPDGYENGSGRRENSWLVGMVAIIGVIVAYSAYNKRFHDDEVSSDS
eukprot:CAMPEP_0194111378 /NCGR_PEP_ID=MMETSP0150-20130528/10394_1 /TAXON_ID=122233 /ORGANISM="Chaetoceros debilis, Strain MM31A-1" /LENGTH=243 /DNA_ID=CAMNT_0038800791 /DNA_START=95 /DNA_END=826 /DNA_ORIENTATION=+